MQMSSVILLICTFTAGTERSRDPTGGAGGCRDELIDAATLS